MKENLLQIANSKCYLTEDASEEEKIKLERIAENAVAKVSHYIGVDANFDFTQPGFARSLFENYVWYAFNDAEDEFVNNYLQDINNARDYYAAERDNNA